MADKTLGVILNGATGRMGYRQHLVRSILPIIEQGGVELSDGSRVQLDPILVGRHEDKLKAVSEKHGGIKYTTDLDSVLADDKYPLYADFLVTSARVAAIEKAIKAGKKAVYTEKPIAETLEDAVELVKLGKEHDVVSGVVHDKLFLPGFLKLRRLIDSGFFGRILSVHGEFGYWVFEGDWHKSQRPSWNYKKEQGGGMISDMFPHWNYIIENLFGRITDVYADAKTEIPDRWDEQGNHYDATAEDAAYAVFNTVNGITVQMNSSWNTRVFRDELVEFQVDGTLGSAVIGLFTAKIQARPATPLAFWNPDVPDPHNYWDNWQEIATDEQFENGFKAQWEEYIRALVEHKPYPYDFESGARGVRLANLGYESAKEGRKIEVPENLL
ncbi:oxidoreductase [Bifidobacterium primatium]|uniref:Oxidoreductase n=2 Tax=Bifidobacterium TaxID=1678 RepID=A0A2M9HAA3_9BIFI|nr:MULTISPECIES: Gfo/Idh/MocA family oxidoreductase [Bifidobacterium]NEG96491.1 gfo/Idh/MocA family oxidoreductase [Bifidobacterium sp. SMB2]NEH10592.1 gfo/Idh/MocA family oxidoreductase [Bifidobacterium saimiriisciurei]NEH10625.1 gfo/Idh/MocA family oxidoreductase [Bifidobacterium saimiriisciurei]PJM73738.1 oxidoreductase [Bifidobacterium primatium]